MRSPLTDRPIRVLLTVPELKPTASPFPEMTALVEQGPAHGFHVTVCALRQNGWHIGSEIVRDLGGDVMIGRFRPVSSRLRDVPRWLRWNQSVLRAGFDVQHSLDFSSNPAEVLAARSARRPIIVMVRDLGESANLPALRLRLSAASAVAPISAAAERAAITHGAPKAHVTVVPLGRRMAGLDVREERPTFDPVTLLSVGQLVTRKRHEDAIDVLAMVRRWHPDAELLIVGEEFEPGLGQTLLDHAHRAGIADGVHLLGIRDDVADLMRSATVLLHCAESEALGWVLIEAGAIGLPVVAAASGGPEEIIIHGKTGLLAPVRDTEALAQHTLTLLRSPQLYGEIVSAARKRVEESYGGAAMAAQYSELYRSVMRSPK